MSEVHTYKVADVLSKIKMYKKQIDAHIKSMGENGMCAICNANSKALDNGIDKKEYSDGVVNRFQSYEDKVKMLSSFRRALVQSNAATMVTIPTLNQTMTVAEALMLKNDVEMYQQMLRTMRASYSTALHAVENKNARAEAKALEAKASITGDDTNDENINRIAKDNYDLLYNRLRYDLVDPLGISDKISDYEKLIDMLEHELDYVLSISNATTEVTI